MVTGRGLRGRRSDVPLQRWGALSGPHLPRSEFEALLGFPPAMSVTILVGGQWGDEGKVIDLLADRVDMVVRSQGGNSDGRRLTGRWPS